jgi:hypothetical protein
LRTAYDIEISPINLTDKATQAEERPTTQSHEQKYIRLLELKIHALEAELESLGLYEASSKPSFYNGMDRRISVLSPIGNGHMNGATATPVSACGLSTQIDG